MSEIELQLLRAEVDWYREKVEATADKLDRLALKAKADGAQQAAWAFEGAARLVQWINEQPITARPR